MSDERDQKAREREYVAPPIYFVKIKFVEDNYMFSVHNLPFITTSNINIGKRFCAKALRKAAAELGLPLIENNQILFTQL